MDDCYSRACARTHTHSHTHMHISYIEIFARRKFLPILPPAIIGEKFIFLSYVKDCLEDMATFTALAK